MLVAEKREGEPKLAFDVNQGSGGFDFWSEYTSWMYDVEPMVSASNTGRFNTRAFSCELGALLRASYDGQFIRTTKLHTARSANLVFVLRVLSGGIVGDSEHGPLQYRPGDVMINDYAREHHTMHLTSTIEGVYLEKSALGLHPSAPLPRYDFAANTTMAKLLQNEMDGVFAPLLNGEAALHRYRFERFLSCVKVAINGAVPDGDVRTQARRALKELIGRYIEKHLEAPELSTVTLLREFGVSRATLYRMFEPEGGVRNYISSRRLFRAITNLSREPGVRGKIHEVAERWGFSSDANFSRSVRRAYGAAPGALFRPDRAGRRRVNGNGVDVNPVNLRDIIPGTPQIVYGT